MPKPRKNTVRNAVTFVVVVLSVTVLATLLKGSAAPLIPDSSADELHEAFREDPLPQRLFAVKGVVTGFWENGYLLQVTVGARNAATSPGFLVEAKTDLPILSDSVYVAGTLTERKTIEQRQVFTVQALPQPERIVLVDPLPASTEGSAWAKWENLRIYYRDAAYRVALVSDRYELIPLVANGR